MAKLAGDAEAKAIVIFAAPPLTEERGQDDS
jgi:hypothetical protein